MTLRNITGRDMWIYNMLFMDALLINTLLNSNIRSVKMNALVLSFTVAEN